jgi:DNA-binding NarL/FixJ family response regulator
MRPRIDGGGSAVLRDPHRARETAAVRILIADDHEITRRALRQLLEPRADWEVCGEAATGPDAVALAERARPDIVILDLSMPGLDGIDVTRHIHKMLPNTRILVFSMHDSEDLAHQVLAAGAHGYLLKSDATAHVEPAVEALLQRKAYFTPGIAEVLLSTLSKNAEQRARAGERSLTTREREILRLLASGSSSKEIARALDLAVATVQTHRATIMRKLNVNSIAGLVRYALRNKIVEP